ncbi:MAG: sugar phosphate nucleotidyltransferase [Thermoplasmata archaeon]
MQAVILAGGLGTRLRPITYARPKALVPLLNRPMVLHVLDALPPAVDEVLLAASYMIEALEAFFAARTGGPKVTLVEEREPLGTGGALRNLEGALHGTFIALNGDVISSVDLERLVAFHRARGGIGTLALWDVADPEAYGIVGVEEDGRIERFLEKPSPDAVFSHWINAGAYVFEEGILSMIPPGRPVSLEREVFPAVLPEGLYGLPFQGYWSDAGTLEQYLEATRLLLDRRGVAGGERQALDTEVIPPVSIAPSAVVAGGTVGPYVSLGGGCRITGAHLSRSVLLDEVVVEAGAAVVDSLIGVGATIGKDALVRGCIIGDGASVRVGSQRVAERVEA